MALRHEARGERGNVWQGVGTRAIPKIRKISVWNVFLGKKKPLLGKRHEGLEKFWF